MNKDFMLLSYDKTGDNFPFDTLPLTAYVYEVFINIATKNKTMYKQAIREGEAKIFKDRAQKTVQFL